MKTSPVDTLRKQLSIRRTPAQAAALYDKHNQRCHELGLHRLTDAQLQGQGCQYSGGFPVALPADVYEKIFCFPGG